MILFHDVDGCLNTPDGAPLDFTGAHLEKNQAAALGELGKRLDQSTIDHFVVNTGRSWAATRHLCAAIGSTKARFALTEHGAELWDFRTNTAIDLQSVSVELELPRIRAAFDGVHRIHELISWFRDAGSSVLRETLNHPGEIRHQEDKSSNLTIPIPASTSGDALLGALKSAIANDQRFAEDTFTFHQSNSAGFIDVMSQVDKGMGVELVTRYLAEDLTKTLAVGDGLNDLPMLRAVNFPICPANAEPEVQVLCATNGHLSEASYIEAVHSWLPKAP